MRSVRLSCLLCMLAVGGAALSACSTTPGSDSPFGPFPDFGSSKPAETPARYTAEEIVGRWGVASYHKDADRARTEAAARKQCGKASTITKGPNGGVMMPLADQRTPVELKIKTSADGLTFIGPEGEGGGAQDREILSFDGRVLVMRYTDPATAGRFGTMVYVRCAPRA